MSQDPNSPQEKGPPSSPYPGINSYASYPNSIPVRQPIHQQSRYQSLPYHSIPLAYQQSPYQQTTNQLPPYQQWPYQQSQYQQPPYQQPPNQPPPYQQPPYQQPIGEPYPHHLPTYNQALSHGTMPSLYHAQATKSVNLIANPNFEAISWNENGDTVDIKQSPWEIMETGGDGWRLEKTPQGSKVDKCPAEAGQNANCVVGSFEWCKRSQTIDLLKKGFVEEMLDSRKPPIRVYEWFIARSDCDSEYYMDVTLLDQHENPLDSFKSGTRAASSSEWQKVEHVFHSYPSGVRFIRFEDGTKDKKFWTGHFGAKMCEPTVLIEKGGQPTAPILPAATFPASDFASGQVAISDLKTKNLLKNPSFLSKAWSGRTSSLIDFQPWTIEKNEGGYVLEKYPQGTANLSFPDELSEFDVWCVATSNSQSKRSQLVDLTQNGFAAHILDVQRPPIKTYEWFTSRTDCQGEYVMRVSLLDQRRMEIPGYVFDTGVKKAPSGSWVKEEYTFMNIPPGVRYVKFSDGGNDCENCAGYYGAKMVGAFVGVLAELPGNLPSPPPQHPQPKNLLKNSGLRPKSDWDGETCSNIDFSGWEIIENDGNGIQLENFPKGTKLNSFPAAPGHDQHCISTSHGWFKRRQTIDLLEHGIIPHYNAALKLYVCEWFASRIDNDGEYYLKVSLLDNNHKAIRGCSYDSGVSKAYSDEWEKVEHSFSPVPKEARFVLFEDGGKDVKVWAGQYGVKMFGASVYAGKKSDNDEECVIL